MVLGRESDEIQCSLWFTRKLQLTKLSRVTCYLIGLAKLKASIMTGQLQNGILLPSLRPSLPFLDLHGIRRLEFHQAIMEDLRDRLLQRVSELAAKPDKNNLKTLNDLLTKSFPVVNVKSLRPVVLCIMQHLPKIKQEYLSVIVENKELYKESSVEVKQQIWQDNQALFGDEVSPLLSKYIDD
ncbi:hypothetical protein CAPTEDRAFT_189620, partial [Capitella teleta]